MVAEAQQQLVAVDLDVQLLLSLRDRFLHAVRQQLEQLAAPPAPERAQAAQQRIRIADAQGLQAALHVHVHPVSLLRGGNSARGGSRQSRMVNGDFAARPIRTTASMAATAPEVPAALA